MYKCRYYGKQSENVEKSRCEKVSVKHRRLFHILYVFTFSLFTFSLFTKKKSDFRPAYRFGNRKFVFAGDFKILFGNLFGFFD